MTEARQRVTTRLPYQVALAGLVAVPGAYLGAASYLGLPHLSVYPLLGAFVFGIAIVGAAFILSWAAEAAQKDINAGLAIALLALLAVLPEYAVEIAFLGAATVYSLTLPLKSTLTLWDSAIFIGIFVLYGWRLSKMSPTEPDLLGVSAWVGAKEKRSRKRWVFAMFVVAAIVILLTAEHFAAHLVSTGERLGISQFLLVQWVAPLASESPELIIACLYAWRLKAANALGALLSSKVNQWTLLVGSLPIVFAISATTWHGLPLDTQQRFELLITAAQSLFAVSLLLDRKLTFRGAVALFGLFLVQFFTSILASTYVSRVMIIVLSIIYVGTALFLFARYWRKTARIATDGTITPFDKLSDEPV